MPPDLSERRSCPLVGREIDAGFCLEVNLERLEFFKPDALADVMRQTGLTVEQVSARCEVCPHQPLTD